MGLTNERAILGSVVMEPTVLSVVYSEGVREETFFDTRHREIYRAMLHLQSEQRNIDYVTLYNYLEDNGTLDKAGGTSYVASIGDEFPAPSAIKDYCTDHMDYYVGRKIKKFGADLAGATDMSGQQLLSMASMGLNEINLNVTRKNIVSLEDCMDDVVDAVMEGEQMFGLPTYYSAIDNIIMGLPPGGLITIASRPGMGKSALMLNILKRQAENGISSGLSTMEMNRDELALRLLGMEANISTDFLKSGTLGNHGKENVNRAAKKLKSLPIYIEDSSGMSVFSLASMGRRLKHENDIGILVVDYLQLMDTDRAENRNLQIGLLTRSLKKLAGELHIPIVAISQLNREVDNRGDHRPTLSDLRESGNIEQDSDMVIFIYRSSYYNLVTPNEDQEAEIIISKNRGGRMGTAYLRWIPETTTFADRRY